MRVIIAARLSRKATGAEREGLGIQTQDERAREWAAREGHTIVATVADTVTGTKAPFDRKNLGKWVTSPQLLGRYDAIVAFKIDRLSRADQAGYRRIETWASDHGKRLMIVDGPQYPARDAADRITWEVFATQANSELEAIKERCGRAQDALRADGKLVGKAAFGYVIDGGRYNKELVPDPVTAPVVAEVFRRVEHGATLTQVQAWCAGQRHAVYLKTLRAMIKNPVYCGQRSDGYQAPAIVDATTWRNANAALDGKHRPRPAGSGTPKAMLACVLKCGRCGAPMHRITPKNARTGKEYASVYRCAGAYGPEKSNKGKGCGNILPLTRLEALVSAELMISDRRITEVRPREASTARAELDALKVERKQLDDDAPDYDTRHAALSARIRELQASLKNESSSPYEVVELDETYADRWNSLGEPDRGAWLRKSGVRIYAQPVSEVEHWTTDVSDDHMMWVAGDAEISLMIQGSLAA